MPPIRDLFDFYHYWPELREKVISLNETVGLDPEIEFILKWMVKLIDRVGPEDFGQTPDQ